MKREDVLVKRVKEDLAKHGITSYREERLLHLVSLADAAIPTLEPETYAACASEGGQLILSFSIGDFIVDVDNRAEFIPLFEEASVIRFRKHEADGELLRVLLYFDLK